MNDATTRLSVVEKVAYAVGDIANNLTLQALQPPDSQGDLLDFANQLNLFDL